MVCDESIYTISNSDENQYESTQQLLDLKALRRIEKSKFKQLRQPLTNSVVALAMEIAKSGYGALVFCGGRQSCQQMALLISEAMPAHSSSQDVLDRRKDVLDELRSLAVGLDDALGKTLMHGVAFYRSYFLVSLAVGSG